MTKLNIMSACLMVVSALSAENVSVTYKVVDENGVPIEGALVETIVEKEGSLLRWYGSPKYDRYSKTTDTSGVAVCNFRTHDGDFCASIKAEGFYKEEITARLDTTYNMESKEYCFAEKNKYVQICLRKIVAPIAMNSCRHKVWRFPSSFGVFGFDFEKGSWVKPWGKGRIADISVYYSQYVTNGIWRSEGRIVFNNGGAYKQKKKSSSSGFVSDYLANTNAAYISDFSFSSFCATTNSGEHGAVRVLNDDEYLTYRTRIDRNEDGEIISAHYGKIYGPIRTVGFLRFEELFFNPTPNDPNIEEKR